MKRLLPLALCIIVSSALKAQDVIIFKDATELKAKIVSISQDEVGYKRWSNMEGPTYTTSKSQIFYIKYENGEKDVMSTIPQSNISNNVCGYATLGVIFTADGAGPALNVSIGTKVSERGLYLGVETGFYSCFTRYIYHSSYPIYHSETRTIFEAYIPLGVNIKYNLMQKQNATPYADCSFGGFFGVGEALGEINGFRYRVGLGIDIKRFTLGAGYESIIVNDAAHMGYVRLGFRFGK